ncbi:hypothetical protein NE237_018876 [Protea cynaroides]|uniref:Uncharacterized protein n=1 Tax=Protea cynaroides TaxID=273540 RepID=A0A9Q0KAT6_9MAGN|nr:hypothetical protein NE237_018876 [Protea cynaroides]
MNGTTIVKGDTEVQGRDSVTHEGTMRDHGFLWSGFIDIVFWIVLSVGEDPSLASMGLFLLMVYLLETSPISRNMEVGDCLPAASPMRNMEVGIYLAIVGSHNIEGEALGSDQGFVSVHSEGLVDVINYRELAWWMPPCSRILLLLL